MNSWKATVQFYTLIFLFSFSIQFFSNTSLAQSYYSPEVQNHFQSLQKIHKHSFTQNFNNLSLLPSAQLLQLKKQFTQKLFDIFPKNDTNPCAQEDIACFTRKRNAYRQARRLLFGKLHLKGHSTKTYAIEGVYCSKTFTNKDFPKNANLGPKKIPAHTIMNAEHIWPQSRFSNNYPDITQQIDLHILYPSDSKVNSQRGNHLFGEVEKSIYKVCGTAKKGLEKNSSKIYFEPPTPYKGNVARAMFYFSLKYKMPISKKRQEMFKRWSKIDPVDNFERTRNEEIFKLTKTRNPFIDQPESILYISDSWGE